MTRKEEIKQESKRRHLEKYNQEGFCPDFEKGAEWADQHISAETFGHCIYMLNNTCYEDDTGVDESDIEYTIKQNNLL